MITDPLSLLFLSSILVINISINVLVVAVNLVGSLMLSLSWYFLIPRANGAERRSGRKPGARVLIPPGYLHPGKRKH
jgi:hypothetical protein